MIRLIDNVIVWQNGNNNGGRGERVVFNNK